MELFKKYRPKRFEDLIGCTSTATALATMVEKGTLPHSILLSGPSGTGKTTIARILKDALGCHDFDYQEINSASFRGIDTIREIQRQMYNSPGAGPCRVYLLDEVHMLSKDAMNGALKMLEDTPSHVYFILATTDPSKLITAVRTRCSDMPVRALTHKELEGLVRDVSKKEGIELDEETVDELAAAASGSARTLLVLLEKIAHLSPGDRAAAITETLAQENAAIDLCRALIKPGTKWRAVAEILKNLTADPEEVRYAVLGYARQVLLKGGAEMQAAYVVIECFAKPFYDSKAAGLAAACYEAIHSPDR
mgnify:CR=1 FL=1